MPIKFVIARWSVDRASIAKLKLYNSAPLYLTITLLIHQASDIHIEETLSMVHSTLKNVYLNDTLRCNIIHSLIANINGMTLSSCVV